MRLAVLVAIVLASSSSRERSRAKARIALALLDLPERLRQGCFLEIAFARVRNTRTNRSHVWHMKVLLYAVFNDQEVVTLG
jgi:hypothetical protein